MAIKYKTYRVAFSGNKIHRLREIVDIVTAGGYTKVFEPFGGSGCIGINLKANGLVDEAVINDYDGFIKALPDYINTRDQLQQQLDAAGLEPHGHDKVDEDAQRVIVDILKPLPIATQARLAEVFCHSGRANVYRLNLEKDVKYYKRRLDNTRYIEYANASKLVTLDQCDWREFIERHRESMTEGRALLVLDPPYLNSSQKQYSADWFGLAKSIELLNMVKDLNVDFLLFNQIKEDTAALLDLYGFNYTIATKGVNISGGIAVREDVMAYICNLGFTTF